MTLIKRRTNEKRNRNERLFPAFTNENFWNEDTDVPLANISETDEEYKYDLSVPGFKKEDFQIGVDNGILTISSEKEEDSEMDINYRTREFSYNSFCRAFQLPEDVDENNINARYQNGLLEVTVPKKDVTVSQPRRQIQVV